ncbi:FAD-binding domain-containing protein [uncultured Aquincola sp.]|uniref:FAD-binding domain-containing protein n=1 Tax=uncultured Aquincola sp. TaxID=886556 RepID=UPI0032B1FFD4
MTRAQALARIAAIDPAAYARSRNALDGAVSGLSPWITHGVVSLPEVAAGVAARHPGLHLQHRFVMELGWREFFRHVWAHRGSGIFESLHAGPLPDGAYAAEVPADVREARTGVPVIDQAVRQLYAQGLLHNHARLWLASYLVHLRKVHWRAGADWLLGHLLDGDLASNHLSWQWVAGTGSHQPYLFNAENVARFAPADWHSPGSVIDTDYDTLDAMARSPQPVPARVAAPAAGAGREVQEPPRHTRPPAGLLPPAPAPGWVAGRDVWLLHPWALRPPPADVLPDAVCLGWWPAEHHAAWPWTDSRWRWAAARLAELTQQAVHADRATLAALLAGARSVQAWSDPHADPHAPAAVQLRPPQRLFDAVERPCASFSSWWKRSTRGVKGLAELPGWPAGVAALSAPAAARR